MLEKIFLETNTLLRQQYFQTAEKKENKCLLSSPELQKLSVIRYQNSTKGTQEYPVFSRFCGRFEVQQNELCPTMIVTDLHVSGIRFNNPLLPMEHILKSSQDVAAANKIIQFLKSRSKIQKFGSSHLSSLVSPPLMMNLIFNSLHFNSIQCECKLYFLPGSRGNMFPMTTMQNKCNINWQPLCFAQSQIIPS